MTDQRRNIVLRFGVVYFIISLLFIGVIYKIIQIQYFERDQWMELADKQKMSDIMVRPKRGNIYAADGRLLASSIPTYTVFMDMGAESLRINSGKLFYDNLDSLSLSLSRFFGDRTPAQYKRALQRAYRDKKRSFQLYPHRISYSQLKELRKLPLFRLGRVRGGLYEREFVRRVKPFGSLASRTIGDVYPDESLGGRSGIEGSFNEQLLGTPGISTRQKVANRYLETVDVEPIDGLDIYTTLDVEIQDIAEKALRDVANEYAPQSACAVVMEVKTGEIKAMVNLDRNERTGEYYEGVNHALTNRMEPGSTFKIASLIAVLDEGKVKKSDNFDIDGGVLQVANRVLKDHNYHRGGYDTLHVDEIIHASSNVGTAKMVMKSFGSRPEKYIEKLYDLRLNDSLPIQMKGVAKPWIKHPKKDKKQWYKTSLAWMSIGYETKIPPIYTLTLYNAIANNGKMMNPIFVKSVKRHDEIVKQYEPEVLKESICKPGTLKDVQEIMLGVIEGKYGTARSVKSNIVRIAGKTGTAQISQGGLGYRAGQTYHNVSFCGYFPADNPQYSAIVLLTAPQGIPSGGRMAGSAFKTIAERTMIHKSSHHPDYLKTDTLNQQPYFPDIKYGNPAALKTVAINLNIPLQEIESQTIVQHGKKDVLSQGIDVTKSEVVPDVCGMGAKDAVYLLNNLGLQVKLRGLGEVIAQSLTPGTELSEGSTIELFLE
ncbi:MAG TPA: penicillin-binding transpeptidase domain-containing protein [Paludibacter sp.]|nr:penicillin-binding transpeptidase domain-containing protein [Paludibacter sp.]